VEFPHGQTDPDLFGEKPEEGGNIAFPALPCEELRRAHSGTELLPESPGALAGAVEEGEHPSWGMGVAGIRDDSALGGF
jgi:hypothetical protein